MGIIPTLVLLPIWKVSRSPYLVSKCYEWFYVFSSLCLHLILEYTLRLISLNELKVLKLLIQPSPLSNLAYHIYFQQLVSKHCGSLRKF